MDKQQDKPMAEACNILEEPNKEIEAITAARAQLGRKLTTELDKAKALQAEIDRRIKTLASLTGKFSSEFLFAFF
ncbi:hypothetical protein NKR23_g2642 [Pleurostoma richardsiae]|uniref:Uncharacterized protein n=1 Tax=Pleurostoma richardsiae TaxID=41990 RepID=A0AA38VI03_9PEZI|nr:hypothetical protein NKR23_g2642 [Pleurostoma richardsiae]